MGSLSINLLGTTFKINAQQDDEYLQQLLNYYSNVISKLQQTIPHQEPLQTAILAGILISDELYTQKYTDSEPSFPDSHSRMLSQVNDMTKKMISTIDQVL